MSSYREQGYFKTTPTPAADLGEVVAGEGRVAKRDSQRVIAINLGLAP